MNADAPALSLALRNLLFTLVVPVSGAVVLPRWVLARFDNAAAPAEWAAVGVIALGIALHMGASGSSPPLGVALPVPGTRHGISSRWGLTGGCAIRSTSRR